MEIPEIMEGGKAEERRGTGRERDQYVSLYMGTLLHYCVLDSETKTFFSLQCIKPNSACCVHMININGLAQGLVSKESALFPLLKVLVCVRDTELGP